MVGCDRFTWERLVRRCLDLTPTEKHVALTMSTWSDSDGTNVYPGTKKLCQATGRSEPVILRALSSLRQAGFAERVYDRSGNGRRGIYDVYRLTYPADILTRFRMLDPD